MRRERIADQVFMIAARAPSLHPREEPSTSRLACQLLAKTLEDALLARFGDSERQEIPLFSRTGNLVLQIFPNFSLAIVTLTKPEKICDSAERQAGADGDDCEDGQPYDTRPCRGVPVPPGMTREMIVGVAKIISDSLFDHADKRIDRYLAEMIARDAISFLRSIHAISSCIP